MLPPRIREALAAVDVRWAKEPFPERPDGDAQKQKNENR
jgi:hypothetical protein